MQEGGQRFIWTSGRKCDFDGCEDPSFQPTIENGWFWTATGDFSKHNPILNGGPSLSFLNRQNLVHFQACVWRRPRIAWTANGVTRAKGESRSRTTASSKKRFVPARDDALFLSL